MYWVIKKDVCKLFINKYWTYQTKYETNVDDILYLYQVFDSSLTDFEGTNNFSDSFVRK